MTVTTKTNVYAPLNNERAQLEAIANLPVDKSKEPVVDMKFDNNKPIAGILFEDFPNALSAVVDIGTFGANKYKRNSWLTVPNAEQRYKDAMIRHQLAIGRGELYDPESGLLHAAHFAWNALAILELYLRSSIPGTSYIAERHIVNE